MSNPFSERLRALRDTAQGPNKLDPVSLAEAFGWDREQCRKRRIHFQDVGIDVGRSYYGLQPAALFATAYSDIEDDVRRVDLAAMYAYHASVRWGVYANRKGLTPFHSHWLSKDRFFSLPTVSWDQIESSIDLLNVFRPDELVSGAPDRLALERFSSPARLLQPVDDELVEQLDNWREIALSGSQIHTGVDEQLQTLFAKLFVLRTIEDKELAPSVTPLSRALKGPDGLNMSALIEVFDGARQYIGSELFDTISLDLIPAHVIAGVINDLYVPRRIGFAQFKYNFSWIDADVLGLAYEKYLSTILNPLTPSKQPDLFHGPTVDVERISVRKAGGVYYTPRYLTNYLAKQSIDGFFEAKTTQELPKIVDFACGSGSFLVSAMDVLLTRLKAEDGSEDWARKLIEGGFITGIDIDEKAVTVARLNLWNRLAEEPNPLPLPNLSKVIVQGDGLDIDSWGDVPRKYDVVLGNPPFLATSRVLNREKLETRFSTAKGRYDFSYLFVEQAVRVTDPDGILGMVVPNRLFRNRNAAPIRTLICERMNLLSIVDFGSTEVFIGTSAYIGCLVAQHQPLMSTPAKTVSVIDVRKLPEHFVSSLLLEGLESQESAGAIRRYKAQHPRGGNPWILLSDEEKSTQVRISEASTSLREIASIFQGIRTGANDVFIVRIEEEGEQFVRVSNDLGDTAFLERDILEPVVFGSEVQRYGVLRYSKLLLYPYKDGRLISERELERLYPQCYKYLHTYRTILSSRTSIKASGLRWYEIVRRRDEKWLRAPKLLIRDLSPETAFAPDEAGSLFMVGGTAVVPETEELLYPLLAYLNSKPLSTLIKRVTPQFRGGFQKFEPHHLQDVPVLNQLLGDAEFSDRLAGLAASICSLPEGSDERDGLSDEIDSIINAAFAEADIDAEE